MAMAKHGKRDARRAVAVVQRLDLPEARPIGRRTVAAGSSAPLTSSCLPTASIACAGVTKVRTGASIGNRAALVLAEAHRADQAGRRAGDDADLALQRAGQHVAVARLQQEPGGERRQQRDVITAKK
jgi:hypothetical protein